MTMLSKYATAAALTGVLALAAATPSQARHWHHGGGAALGGFVAGAAIGAAVANGGDGYYGPGYYGPGYGYEDSYAYAPGPAYYGPAPRYYGGSSYRGSNTSCGTSPASTNFGSCN